jgi:tRNA wybutosine-synthesizing protein 4
LCKNTTFVDVDYPKLMKQKCGIISRTEQITSLLDDLSIGSVDKEVLLRSDQYVAVACDLRELDSLDRTLRKEFDLSKCTILLVAEVSIAYMEVSASDALITWSAGFGDGELLCDKVVFMLEADISQYTSASLNNVYRMERIIHLQSGCLRI